MSRSIDKPADVPRTHRLRTVIEMGACLAILVALFRTFLAGGYLIETGSMAPCLVGHHRRAVCPSCRFPFAVEGSSTSIKTVCPNCGKGGIAVDKLPRNDGDHLLVHRGIFEFRRPRRWEVAVFRNPNKPTQAYVKRIIGLPGESLRIEEGDVFVSGEIQAKSYATQRGIRVPVYDHDYRPPADEPDWRPRWVVENGDRQWHDSDGSFRFLPDPKLEKPRAAWVNYRHWIRRGGSHATSVPLASWPDSLEPLKNGFGPLKYDEEQGILACRGALPVDLRDQLLNGVRDPEFRRTIEKLYDASHVAPITDVYGYNRGHEGQGHHEVRDLMFSANVLLHDGPGQFVLAIGDGAEEFRCVFDVPSRKVRLIDSRTGRAMRTAHLGEALLKAPVMVEFSLMDRQVLLAIAGQLAFEPWRYAGPRQRGERPVSPARFGAVGTAVEVGSLKLFRDVYYTDDSGRRAVDAPLALKPNEYFVLGDNSPVSKDSRSWPPRVVLSSEMFLGKPLVVHLPSRKKRFQIGSWQTEIRIPELSQIRYIH